MTEPTFATLINETERLDAVVFEYLLGELTSIVSEHGKGQLIFTSHNLHQLETIDRGFIALTSVERNSRKRQTWTGQRHCRR
jgi:hypothetical protein